MKIFCLMLALISSSIMVAATFANERVARPLTEYSSASQKIMQAYLARREALFDVPEAERAAGELELAKWCFEKNLDLRGRAHALESLRLNPNQTDPHQLLGHVRVGNLFMDPLEYEEQSEKFDRIQAGFAKYESKLNRWVTLSQRDDEPVKSLSTRLKTLTDDDAVWPVARAIVNGDAIMAEAGLAWLIARTDAESIEAVTRVAMLDSRLAIRKRAAEHLATVDEFSFVPQLLRSVEGKCTVTEELITHSNGLVLAVEREYRIHEGDAVNRMIHTANIQYQSPSEGRPSPGTRASIADDHRTLGTRIEWDLKRMEDQVEVHNDLSTEMTGRAAYVLRKIDSSIPGEVDKADLVRWWYGRNRYQLDATSPPESAPQMLTTTADYELGNSLAVSKVVPPAPPCECLVAGTLVWTDQGPRAIETLELGDVVLSLDIETGETCYQPVLQRTQREPEELSEIETTQQKITASGGHPFWVVNRGWVMAEDLRPGDVLYALEGNESVVSVRPVAAAETFNLVVDRTECYFVGASKVLSHDIQLRQSPTTGKLEQITALSDRSSEQLVVGK